MAGGLAAQGGALECPHVDDDDPHRGGKAVRLTFRRLLRVPIMQSRVGPSFVA